MLWAEDSAPAFPSRRLCFQREFRILPNG